jgi:hypothetical protein
MNSAAMLELGKLIMNVQKKITRRNDEAIRRTVITTTAKAWRLAPVLARVSGLSGQAGRQAKGFAATYCRQEQPVVQARKESIQSGQVQ